MKSLRPSFVLITVALAACGSDGSFGDALVFTIFAKEYATSAAKKTALCAFDAAGRTLL